MMIKSVREGKSPMLLAGVLALMTQSAWSDETQEASEPVAVAEAVAAARQRVEADAQAYIEALNQRLSEELARDYEAIGAARTVLVIAEVPTRG
jgi:hypothetical protein